MVHFNRGASIAVALLTSIAVATPAWAAGPPAGVPGNGIGVGGTPPVIGAGGTPPGIGVGGTPPGIGAGGTPPGIGVGGTPPGIGVGGQPPGIGVGGTPPGHGGGMTPPPGGGGGGVGGGGGGGGAAKAAARSGGGHASAPWPVWVLGIGTLSLIIRGVVVYRTECRELTTEEAIGGLSVLWPVFHQSRSQCPDAVAAVPVRPRKAAIVTRY